MKRILWFGLAAAFAVLAASCSQNAHGASNSGKPVTVRVSWYGDENRNNTYNATFDVIQKEMPNVQIVREFAAASQYWTKMSTELAGGGAPDLMIFTLDNIADFADRGVLMNLQSYVDKGVIDTKDLDASIIDSGKVNGILYGISQGNSIKGTYYNKTMFQNAKVPDPSFNWSWDEFSNDMIAIHKALGPQVWGAEDDGGISNIFQTFLKQRGKDLYSAKGGLGFDKSDMIAWYTIWENMRKQGGIPPADVSTEYAGKQEVQGILHAGKVAITMSSSNRMKLFQDVMKDPLGIVQIPQTPGGQEFDLLAGVYSSINVKSKVPLQTAEIINRFTNDLDTAKIFGLMYGPVPNTKILKGLEPGIDPVTKQVIDYQIAVNKYATSTVPYPIGSDQVNALINTENSAIGFNQMSISAAVDDFFSKADKILTK